MTTGICVGCNLNIAFDKSATDEEKPYPFWEGMWRAPTTGSTVCEGENAHVKGYGYPARVFRMHDPVQRFLVTFHSCTGSMGEAVTPNQQWLVATRGHAYGLREAIDNELTRVRYEDYLIKVHPLGIDVAAPDPDGTWATTVALFYRSENLDELEDDE